MKRIVFTGGVHAGKTTVLNELEKLGFTVAQETGMMITDHYMNNYGVDALDKKVKEDFVGFTEEWFEFQKYVDSKIPDVDLVIHDRHYLDMVAFAEFFEGEPCEKVVEEAKKQKYDQVFLFETLSNFDARKETGRLTDTKEKADKQKELMRKTYEEFGCDVIDVPEMPVKERVDFVLEKLNS